MKSKSQASPSELQEFISLIQEATQSMRAILIRMEIQDEEEQFLNDESLTYSMTLTNKMTLVKRLNYLNAQSDIESNLNELNTLTEAIDRLRKDEHSERVRLECSQRKGIERSIH